MVHPIILIAVLIAGLLICFGSRNKALTAFLTAALLIPVDQVLLIGSLHFPMLRLLIVFGAFRMIREKASGTKLLGAGWNKIDLAMIVLSVATALDGVVLYPESSAVVNQLGNLYSAFGAYFLLRFLIRDEGDVVRLIRALAYICLVVAAIMTYEQATGRNPYYAFLGGSRATLYGSSLERDDRFRATGCFGHPILAGTFGAICLPLFVGLYWRAKKNRVIAGLGIVAATVIALAANSSTAMLGFLGGLAGLSFWPLRQWMRPIRWATGLILVGLQVALKSPVWHLITRIDITGGSSSYHRYQLINQCVLHFSEWWAVGTKSYADWGWDMWDLSNQYVLIADNSGLIPLLAFIAIIIFAFKYVGNARRLAVGDRKRELLMWALGSSLFANVVAFFGIGYFDQTIVAWYALLGVIPVAACSVRLAARDRKREKREINPEPVAFEPENAAALLVRSNA